MGKIVFKIWFVKSADSIQMRRFQEKNFNFCKETVFSIKYFPTQL